MAFAGKKVVSSGELISEVPHIVNSDGQYLYCKYWEPEGTPTSLIFLAHGFGAHCSLFDQMAEHFNTIGAYVFSHDHIGHGESEGEAWYLDDFSKLKRDVLQHIDMLRSKYPDIPLFLFGHSLGGCIALLVALDRPGTFRGVIVTGGSMVTNPNTITPFRLFLLRNVAWVFPRMKTMRLTKEWLSRDKNQVKASESDPLRIHEGVIVQTALTIIDLAERTQAVMEKIEFPLFILHGGADKITNSDGSKMLYEKAKSKDKTLKILPEMFHNLHQELMEDRLMYFDLLTSWFKERIN